MRLHLWRKVKFESTIEKVARAPRLHRPAFDEGSCMYMYCYLFLRMSRAGEEAAGRETKSCGSPSAVGSDMPRRLKGRCHLKAASILILDLSQSNERWRVLLVVLSTF